MLARPSAGIGVVKVQKPMVFCDFYSSRATLCGDRRGRGAKAHVFVAISAVLAQRSVGSGVVEVQKREVFCDFCCSSWSSGVFSWFARLRPEPAGRGFDSSLVRGGRRKMQLAFAQSKWHRATCADQLAPTSLRRAPCLEQLAQSNLRRATCTEQLAQSSLHRATCGERNLHRATCREPLAGTNLPEQLARSNLRRATCTVQLA